MPDISLCADAAECVHAKDCFRNPAKYSEVNKWQSYSYFANTVECPKFVEKKGADSDE